jgi:hypothetical protein
MSRNAARRATRISPEPAEAAKANGNSPRLERMKK